MFFLIYHRCIFVPLVDHLLVELETRFSPHHCVALLGLCLVASTLVTRPDQDGKIHLAKLVDLYEEDLASPESVGIVAGALHIAGHSCSSERSFRTLMQMKTYLRSTWCGNERLTSLALMDIHRKWWTRLHPDTSHPAPHSFIVHHSEYKDCGIYGWVCCQHGKEAN